MNKEQIREIFIEEASEIIEKLDVDIINFEENPAEKDILNELFRGVHTLKGSANSFGFTRLGTFVHSFEDVLDYYRNNDEIITQDGIDLFLEAVDIIKEVMYKEVEGDQSLPENYDKVLGGIKEILSHKSGASQDTATDNVEQNDLAAEFSDISIEVSQENFPASDEKLKDLLNSLSDDEKLYQIALKFDDDIYFRGYDHAKLMKSLSIEGRVIASWWDMNNVPALDKIDPRKSYIKEVSILFASSKDFETIKEVFEYVEEYEYVLSKVKERKPEPKPIDQVEIKYGNRKEDNEEPAKKFNRRKSDLKSFVKIETGKLDELFDSIGELVIAQNFITESDEIKGIKSESVIKTMNLLSKITKLVQNRVMSLRMVAVHDTFEKMKRVARDASKKVDKTISLEINGADTEIDKTMVDSLSDPLIHIIRNAIDHGIEDSEEQRVAEGKTATGVITLSAYHRGGNIAIEVSDDGRGINREKVFAKAVERGLISADDELSDTQVFALIMQAGFSTADVISDISGRGVGLDVVRTSIEKLHGRVEINSKLGKGSTFTILLPLTLAIIDGMVVRSDGDTFIIPTLSVIESFVPSEKIVHSMKHKGEFVDLRGEMLPIVRLNHVLETSENRPNVWESTLICVESEKGKYAILVDDLIGRQQVVIKSLGPTLSRIRELSGSAIMGSGDIALILNVEELLTEEI